MAGDEGDLHLPHFIELFGGIVFLESMQQVRGAPAARRSPPTAEDMMTEDPVTDRRRRDGPEAAAADVAPASTTACRSSSTAGWSAWSRRVDVLDALTRDE